MKKIIRYDVMDELAAGNEVYAILFTQSKPIVENAATVSGRVLARYMRDDTIEWYASEEDADA